VVAGAKNDTALARALGVSRQTLSSWRKRGTAPHEAVASFATEKNFSLDYLIHGKGPARRYDGTIDPVLMEEIGSEIADRTKAGAKRPAKLWVGLIAYYSAIVYNRILRIARPEDNPFDFVPDEVRYLLELLARQNTGGTTVRVHPEVARHLEGLGSTLLEAYGGPGVSKVVADQATGKSRQGAKSIPVRTKKP